MTLPQIRNALDEGETPEPGEVTFGSVAEARAWRRERDARAAARRAAAEAAAHRADVARWRRERRGY